MGYWELQVRPFYTGLGVGNVKEFIEAKELLDKKEEFEFDNNKEIQFQYVTLDPPFRECLAIVKLKVDIKGDQSKNQKIGFFKYFHSKYLNYRPYEVFQEVFDEEYIEVFPTYYLITVTKAGF